MRIFVAAIGLLAVVGCQPAGDQAARSFLQTGAALSASHPAWIARQWPAQVAVDQLTAKTENLNLILNGQDHLLAQKLSARTLEDGTLAWHGSLSAAGEAPAVAGTLESAINSIVLVSANGRVSGTLRSKGRTYRLHYTNNAHVLDEINDAGLPHAEEPEEAPVAPDTAIRQTVAKHEPGDAVIRVLVVASKNAGDAHEDVRALAQLAVEESNVTYINSGIGLSLELAGFRQLDYVQHSSSPDLDLRRLRAKDDGYMDDVHPERDRLAADVVVLLVDTIADSCGRVSSRPASEDSAFAYVNIKCIGVSRYTFAHEIGHMLGASHEYVEGINDPFLYGHGYIHEPAGQPGWRTVMANVAAAGSVRLPFWSDPNRSIDGVPMGDPVTADTRRLLEETKWTVAGFR